MYCMEGGCPFYGLGFTMCKGMQRDNSAHIVGGEGEMPSNNGYSGVIMYAREFSCFRQIARYLQGRACRAGPNMKSEKRCL